LVLALTTALAWWVHVDGATAQPRVQFGSVRVADDKPIELVVAPPQPPPQPVTQPPQPVPETPRLRRLDDSDRGGVLIYAMPVTRPTTEQLFRLDSEEVFRERLRMEARTLSPKLQLEFPEADSTGPQTRTVRTWTPQEKRVEPHYVVSKTLFFEQQRFERYGHTIGFLQPAASVGVFVFDMLVWPAWRVTHPFRCYQVNTDCYSPYFQIAGE
jgi:hypothetical protein